MSRQAHNALNLIGDRFGRLRVRSRCKQERGIVFWDCECDCGKIIVVRTGPVIRLPTPPSVNSLYFNRKYGKGRGRIKTPAYRKWLAEADRWLLLQKKDIKKVSGECSVEIRMPRTRGDANNYTKATCDYLVSRELTDDDKWHIKVSIEFVRGMDCCEILITPLDSEPQVGL